jgi:archaellum component FlaC
LGLTFEYDEETHNITNYTSTMKSLYSWLATEQEKFNVTWDGVTITDENEDAYNEDKESIDDIETLIDNIVDAAGRYDDSVETFKDAAEEHADNIDEILSNNFEAL